MSDLRHQLLAESEERIAHFARRVRERGLNPSAVVIVVLDVDHPIGGLLADVLMPGHDWQRYRDEGARPVARGIATLDGIADVVAAAWGDTCAEKLRSAPPGSVAVCCIGDGGITTANVEIPTDVAPQGAS